MSKETRLAVARGLAYLARHQNPDGSWNDRVGRKVHMHYRGSVSPHVGVTSLAGIAFLSAGILPGQGPAGQLGRGRSRQLRGAGGGLPPSYPELLERALEYIMNHTGATGFISDRGSRMYSHAFATLLLAEVYGTGYYRGHARLKDCLKRATGLIVKVQNKEGGWRYRPLAADADMSVTVCQVVALRAARNAGIEVPRDTIRRAVLYVKRSFRRDLGGDFGAFTYQLGPQFRGVHSRHSFALTAAGVTTLYGAGEYNAAEIRDGLRFLWFARDELPRNKARRSFDYYYGQYYAVQAAFQKGGAYWRQWYESIRRDLLGLQEPDGRWTDLVGSNYATAMATIILQFPNQYLPITEN